MLVGRQAAPKLEYILNADFRFYVSETCTDGTCSTIDDTCTEDAGCPSDGEQLQTWSPFNLAQLNLSTSGPGKCVDGKCTNPGQELKQDDPCESTGPSCGTGTSSLILSGPMET